MAGGGCWDGGVLDAVGALAKAVLLGPRWTTFLASTCQRPVCQAPDPPRPPPPGAHVVVGTPPQVLHAATCEKPYLDLMDLRVVVADEVDEVRRAGQHAAQLLSAVGSELEPRSPHCAHPAFCRRSLEPAKHPAHSRRAKLHPAGPAVTQ